MYTFIWYVNNVHLLVLSMNDMCLFIVISSYVWQCKNQVHTVTSIHLLYLLHF